MAGAFCPICYEVVDVLSQNLESVAGCGHVFHESCLQKWVAHSPVSPQCPLCKASCGSRDRQKLYFQTSTDCSQSEVFCSTDRVYSEADRKQILRLEEKERLLKKSLDLARQQISELQAAVEDNKMKLQTISEIARLANEKQNITGDRLRRAEQELDASRKEKNRLMKEMSKLELDIAATKLVDNVDLSEDDVLNLTSAGAGRPQSKDDYIQVLAKALVTRNWAFKNLMTTCNEHCLQKDNAKRESSKLKAKVEQMQARLKEVMNSRERSENATLRHLSDVHSSGDLRLGRSRSPAKYSMNRPLKVATEFSVKPLTSQNINRDEVSRASQMDGSNHFQVERENVDADPLTKHPVEFSPRSTDETCTNAMNNIRVCSSENIWVSDCAKSSISDTTMDESISLDVDALPIPIRRERKSSLVEDSYFNGSVVSWKETARSIVGSTNISRFNLAGPNGPSGRAVVKPPPSFIVPPSIRGNGTSRQGKRSKVATPQGFKIDHFFERH